MFFYAMDWRGDDDSESLTGERRVERFFDPLFFDDFVDKEQNSEKLRIEARLGGERKTEICHFEPCVRPWIPAIDLPRGPILSTLEWAKERMVQLFYYFVKSDNNPKDDPIILWLTGGHVCSALIGFFNEIGLLQFVVSKYDGSLPKLTLNPYSWTKVANILFIDSPVGAGFSYSKTAEGNISGEDKLVGKPTNFSRR
ncbi:hypothetical protein GIB67_027440 [Kingdonia uniflora]|uniref:Uncharacterized protein n=1 Tax=Kingdonia uniflora TaxID=39325 RepID=A0A7J7MF86_9MAGN|nr:hypothetical protein GIB67_027440 [Kingdonia uniflora]